MLPPRREEDKRRETMHVGRSLVCAIRHIAGMPSVAAGGHVPMGVLRLVDPRLTPSAVFAAYRGQEAAVASDPGACIVKRRFDLLWYDRTRCFVRVFQGHSNGVITPPELLEPYDGELAYHGTTPEAWLSISSPGGCLSPMGRASVHMAESPMTVAGYRPNSKVMIIVDARSLREETGILIMRNKGNGVLLCDQPIPAGFLRATFAGAADDA